MHTLSKRQWALALGLALAACAAVLAVTHAGAKAGVSEVRMTSYRTPTGPEMTPEAATTLVVDRFAREDSGIRGPLKVTTVRANLAEATAISNGQKVSQALYGGPADVTEMRLSRAYVVVMEAPAGSVFAPNVSTPPGRAGPTGAVETIVIDAHTGRKEALSLEPTAPPGLPELTGPVLRSAFPAVSTTGAEAGGPLGDVGELAGYLHSGNRALVGGRVVVGHSPLPRRAVQASRTFKHGLFTFMLAPGYYRVAGGRSNHKLCGSTVVRISRHHRTGVTLHC